MSFGEKVKKIMFYVLKKKGLTKHAFNHRMKDAIRSILFYFILAMQYREKKTLSRLLYYFKSRKLWGILKAWDIFGGRI